MQKILSPHYVLTAQFSVYFKTPSLLLRWCWGAQDLRLKNPEEEDKLDTIGNAHLKAFVVSSMSFWSGAL